MQCFKRCVLAGAIMVGIVAAAAGLWAHNIAAWLVTPDAPRPADAIVVLGADPSRVLEAADLYAAGYAPRILLSNPVREKRFEKLEEVGITFPWFEVAGRELLRRRGVPDAAIGEFGNRLRSTAHEAASLASEQPGVKSLLLVTSPYHVFRARLIFQRQLGGDVAVLGIASRYETFPREWWQDAENARNAIMETVKLGFYLIGGRM